MTALYFQNGYTACICGCGRAVDGIKKKAATAACRKRIERRRSQGRDVTVIGKGEYLSWNNPGPTGRYTPTDGGGRYNCFSCRLFIRGALHGGTNIVIGLPGLLNPKPLRFNCDKRQFRSCGGAK